MKIFIDKPKKIEFFNSKNIIDLGLFTEIKFSSFFNPILETLAFDIFNKYKKKSNKHLVLNIKPIKIAEQAYVLEIKNGEINILSSSEVGCYYALLTLDELAKKYQGAIPELRIEDEPDLKVRGFMLDISRSKVPKKEAIFKLIDLLSKYRYNHLELYVEGFSFEYKSMSFVNKDNNYLTVDDYILIEHYANEHFIDLVPNQNGFGHMTEWLKLKEFKDLAMVDGLFEIWGSKRVSSTLNPLDERSYNLVKRMYKDMLSHSTSKYFNMDFDEPYELGYGKTEEVCKKHGKDKVFVDYFNKLALEVKKYNKTPLMWADAIIHSPNALKKVDKDAILIDWGYNDDYPFYQHAQMLNKLKKKYMLASGTSTWSAVSAKYTEMLYSTKNAVEAAYHNNGLGVILTDWGDFGHLQYAPYSYPGIIYASMLMWNYHNTSYHMIKEELNALVGKYSSIIIDLEQYNLQETYYKGYSTKLFNPVIVAELCQTEKDPLEAFTRRCLNQLLDSDELSYTKDYLKFLNNKFKIVQNDEELISNQIKASLTLLDALVLIQEYFTNKDSILFDDIIKTLDSFIVIHEENWKEENLEDGLIYSLSRIKNLKNMLTNYNNVLLKNKKEAQL